MRPLISLIYLAKLFPSTLFAPLKAVTNHVRKDEQLQPRMLVHQRCWLTWLVWWSGLGHQARYRLPISIF